MKLTLQQAAAELGKTPRQIRYLIQTGKLIASKDGHGWRIESADIPRSPAQLEVGVEKRRQLRAAVEDALDAADAPTRRGYSFRELRAAKVGLELHPRLAEHLGADHPATRSLRYALEAVGSEWKIVPDNFGLTIRGADVTGHAFAEIHTGAGEGAVEGQLDVAFAGADVQDPHRLAPAREPWALAQSHAVVFLVWVEAALRRA